MNGVFCFDCGEMPIDGKPKRTMIGFCGISRLEMSDLEKAVWGVVETRLAPDCFYVLVPSVNVDPIRHDIKKCMASGNLALPKDTEIALFPYDGYGVILNGKSLEGHSKKLPEDLHDVIRRRGMTEVFCRQNGLFKAGPTAHFVMPSGDRDVCFLRASHVLVEGVETCFVAFWLLPHIPENVRRINVDSSTIAGIIYAALFMRLKAGVNTDMPVVSSFKSYEGLGKYKFLGTVDELTVISASRSGGLALAVIDKKAVVDRVITLFALFKSPKKGTPDRNGGTVLCDLSYHSEENPNGYSGLPKLDTDVMNSRSLHMVGEQFFFKSQPARDVVPTIKDLPDETVEQINRFSKKNIFRFRIPLSDDDTGSVWVDIDRLTTEEYSKKQFEKLVAQHIPAVTKAIIYVDADHDSKVVADMVFKEIPIFHGEDKPEIVPLSELEKKTKEAGWDCEKVAVVVVAGALGSGRSFLAASRALRTFAPKARRVYLAGFVVSPSIAALDLLRRNLTQPKIHTFQQILSLHVPRKNSWKSWRTELEFFEKKLNKSERIPRRISERVESLKKSGTVLDCPFFSSKEENPLKLRANFAFWRIEEEKCEDLSQADVFVTISALLENMRSGKPGGDTEGLRNDAYSHAVLSPACFGRYNDGVIQAALLRAALPTELDYRDLEPASAQMKDLIAQVVAHRDKIQGEGAMEFMIALVTKRIRLCPDHEDSLDEKLKKVMVGSWDREDPVLILVHHWLNRKATPQTPIAPAEPSQ